MSRKLETATTYPGPNSTRTLIEETPMHGNVRQARRVNVSAFIDQACTLLHEWAAPGSGNFRQVSTDAILASTYFEKLNIILRPGRNRIRITTPAGAVTVWEVGVETITDPA